LAGYKGRTSILEILKINEYMKKLISQNTSAHELAKAAVATGFKTLADDACRRVIEGITSLDEITRVVDLTGRVSS
jgi:general secretion pathway protein E/type IV pilus assembly protein PilB